MNKLLALALGGLISRYLGGIINFIAVDSLMKIGVLFKPLISFQRVINYFISPSEGQSLRGGGWLFF